MCGRMTQQTPPSDVAKIFDAELREDGPFMPSWNVAPTDPVTVVVQRDDGRVVERQRWGLIPAWATSAAAAGAKMINARAETIMASSAFRVAVRKRRCIVPADAFYEWIRDGGKRLPYLLRAADGFAEDPATPLLNFAGLWSVWKDPATGIWVPSCAVVTTVASAQVSPIHNRMPVILPGESWRDWLDPELTDPGEIMSMLIPAEDALEIYPVSPLVNSVRNNGPELAAPLSETETATAMSTVSPAQQTLFG
jgi:putative SOS response-associated peptidase YedK